MDKSIAIIGAGISGLIAAKTLEKAGYSPVMFDSNSTIGGRVVSQSTNSYNLDLGFQVLLTAYPEAKKHLDYDALDLRYFKPGAILFNQGKASKIGDPLRDKGTFLSTMLSSSLTISDKIKVYLLSQKLKRKSISDIFNSKKTSTTANYLKECGFSKKALDNFFIPFFTGIFLEDKLSTPSSMFEFVFKMFSEGSAAIPKNGIGEIPKQIYSCLKRTDLNLNHHISKIDGQTVSFTNSDKQEFDVILKTYPDEGQAKWKSCDNIYFEILSGNLADDFIGLVGNHSSLANNINIHKSGQQNIMSVTIVKEHVYDSSELADQIKKEIEEHCNIYLGNFIEHFKIKKALVDNRNLKYDAKYEEFKVRDGLYHCGDYMLNSSLNAAMLSGERAAEAIIKDLV